MIKIENKDLPGLYQLADSVSVKEQKVFFAAIGAYLFLLITATTFTYWINTDIDSIARIVPTIFFLLTLLITIGLRIYQPDDIWYNGRAVAESVKTRSWRWMMRAQPYTADDNFEIVRNFFINDIKTILEQNKSLIKKLGPVGDEPISEKMTQVRALTLADRYNLYKKERITNQELWYTKKARFNKKRSKVWFFITIIINALAVILLLINIYEPELRTPVEIISVMASSVLSWIQANKYNELSYSYSLASHEIILLKAEVVDIENESEFSDYVINCENAFSREHTQWFARKNE